MIEHVCTCTGGNCRGNEAYTTGISTKFKSSFMFHSLSNFDAILIQALQLTLNPAQMLFSLCYPSLAEVTFPEQQSLPSDKHSAPKSQREETLQALCSHHMG